MRNRMTCIPGRFRLFLVMFGVLLASADCSGQGAGKKKEEPVIPPSEAEIASIEAELTQFRQEVEAIRDRPELQTRDGQSLLSDVRVYEKAASWMLRFREYYRNDSAKQLKSVMSAGRDRCRQLKESAPSWNLKEGTTIRGYVSQVDGSIQPYALTLPSGVDPTDGRRWPLYVVLHGRSDQMNEVAFIQRMDGKLPKKGTPEADGKWIQLDVYGRGNNAYRWAGETDVFEAMADVKRRFRIDEQRITLHGFSMGGAGAWHLGMHYPHLWSSVGPGAGFVDFYRYQKKDPANPADRLPFVQNETLRIYDTVNYALNAANVPVCTYGGENDPQLLASTTMSDAARASQVEIRVIVGPGMGHAFDPESQKAFMDFHAEKSAAGRPAAGQRQTIRFATHTLRYNECDWLAIEETEHVYEASVVEATMTPSGDVELATSNVRAIRISRDAGNSAVIDGTVLDCRSAADGLLPDVYYRKSDGVWEVLDYETSRTFADNPSRVKRPGLQGPIDDAFMTSFLCVTGTGQPHNAGVNDWSKQSLERFSTEFAQWMRGDVRVVSDTELKADQIRNHHLVLFGDPGANRVLARILPELPVTWTADRIRIGDREWSASDHAVCMIFPNPLNPRKYVVINSGHTFHEKDFRSSNAWLFPRLGDVAVVTLQPDASGAAVPVWSEVFDADWKIRPENQEERPAP